LNTLLLSLFGSEIESKYISFKKLLVDHFIEHWGNSFLSKSWISHTDNSLEVASGKDSLLLLDITEFLVFNVDLSR